MRLSSFGFPLTGGSVGLSSCRHARLDPGIHAATVAAAMAVTAWDCRINSGNDDMKVHDHPFPPGEGALSRTRLIVPPRIFRARFLKPRERGADKAPRLIVCVALHQRPARLLRPHSSSSPPAGAQAL